MSTVSTRAWLGILYLSALTSGVAFTLWYWALKRLQAGQVAVFTNLQAPTTALMSWVFFGEIPGGLVVSGGLLVIMGVTLAQLATRRAEREAGEADSDVVASGRVQHTEPDGEPVRGKT